MATTTYITLAQLKTALNIDTGDTSEDTGLNRVIASASRSIDKHCGGRRFWKDDAAVQRKYNPAKDAVWDRDGHLLLVDDIATLTGLVVEIGSTAGGWSPLTDYDVDPDNALADGKPVTGLRRVGGWQSGNGLRVRVTAVFGWPAVPDDVAEATLIQASRLYRRKDSPEGVLGSAEWGAIRVSRVDPDVKTLLTDFVRDGFA